MSPRLLVLPLFLVLAACGSGVDPVSILGDTVSTPSLALPVTNVNIGQVKGFSALVDGFEFLSATNAGQNVTAPAEGTIIAIDNDGTNYSVTVMHNSRFITRLSMMPVTQSSVLVRVGDRVPAGQPLATVTVGLNSTVARLSVFVNGAAVCPDSYLQSNARTDINLKFAGIYPCL